MPQPQHLCSLSSSLSIYLLSPSPLYHHIPAQMFLFSGAAVSVSGSGAIVEAQPHHLISNGVRQGRLRIYPVRTALRHQESPPPRSITSRRMVTSICSSHTGVTASSHKTFPKTNADSLVQPWVIPTNRPIDARLLRVSSNVDSELPKRNFHQNVHTPSWVDPVPFRGTERQWTISNHWHAAQSQLPLRWNRWCSLSLVPGSSSE